jgi:hypothetical protein
MIGSKINLKRSQNMMTKTSILHKAAAILFVIGNTSSAYAMRPLDYYGGINRRQPDSTIRIGFGCAPGYTSPPEGGNICVPSSDKRREALEKCARSIEDRYDTVNMNTQLHRELLHLCTENKMK